jgi:tetratricopeptide (TPR) repeat protein
MSPFRFYIPPVYLRLFDVKADTTILDLWGKKNDLFGGDSEEHFKKTNPKTHVEIMSAWSLLTDPEMRPYQILGASKNIYYEDLNQVYCRLVSRFPLLQFPECNHKISKAYLLLSNPEKRLLNDFFIFDDSVWELYLLECDDEIAVRRTIEREFSGSISKQIINSTLFCYLKACQIEETKGDWELARSYWEKAYLGWQGIFQETFIWEEMRSRVLAGKIFSPFHSQNFNEESLERIRQKLRDILIQNTLECARRACGYSVRATPHHLKFLKYFSLEQESYRSEAARIYNQCAYLLSLDNRLEEARSLLEEALTLDPHLTEIKTNLELAKTATSGMGQALRLLYQNKERDAFELLKKILNEDPQDNDAKELFVTLLHKLSHDSSRMGDYNEASLFLSEACKFRSDYKNELEFVLKARQKNLLAQVLQYLQNEEYEQVIRILKDYIRRYPDQAPPRALMARILNRMAIIKDHQRLWLEARELLREAINLEPDNEVLKSNLERIDQAAENQQIANDLANAAKLIEEGRSKDAINLLQPIDSEQTLPGPIVEEMRLLLASAYFQQGLAMKKEAENATSRGAIREAFFTAHQYMTISCFLNNSEVTRGHVTQLEETIPELVDEQYDPSIFPQPPGGKRRPFVQKKYYRMWRKFRIRVRIFLEFIPKILSTPILIPLTLLPIFGLSYLIVKMLGCGILSALVLALLIQSALSTFFISKIKPEKEKLLLLLSIVSIFLVFGDFLWISMYQQKMPDFSSLFNRQPPDTGTRKPPKPVPTPTPERTSEPVLRETPLPTSEDPGLIQPLATSTPEETPDSVSPVSPVLTPESTKIASQSPEQTPEQTPIAKSTPSQVGQNIEISFSIQELVGIRQSPTPAFVYRITTKDGLATLIMDPLVYIKIPKGNLESGAKIRANVKVLNESDMSVYVIESPKEFHSE